MRKKKVSEIMSTLKRIRKSVLFVTTNETLESITTGLDLSSKDSVLAICGSGNQALGISEIAKKVVAIDFSQAQIEFALLKQELVREGAYEQFRDTLSWSNDESAAKINGAYFSDKVLSRIRKKLPVIQFQQTHAARYSARPNSFTRLYLSNIVGYPDKQNVPYMTTLEHLLTLLKPNGLVYVPNGDVFRDHLRRANTTEQNINLVRDDWLSYRIGRIESVGFWDPIVYRKSA